MTRALRLLSTLAMVLGFLAALPGLALLLLSVACDTALVGREQVAREQALDLEVL